jgi:RecA-family ATPase
VWCVMSNVAADGGARKCPTPAEIQQRIRHFLRQAQEGGDPNDVKAALDALGNMLVADEFFWLMAANDLRYPPPAKLKDCTADDIRWMRYENKKAAAVDRMIRKPGIAAHCKNSARVLCFDSWKHYQDTKHQKRNERLRADYIETPSDWVTSPRAKALTSIILDEAMTHETKILPFPKAKAKQQTESPSLPFINMSRWDETEPPKREWLINDLIPMRQPALFSGEGAVGKSILLLQLLAASSLDRLWLDQFSVAHGPTLYLGAEDESDEIHRRLAAIIEHYKVKFADLIAGGFKALAFAGANAGLAAFTRAGIIQPSPIFDQLYQECCALQPKCIVIDTVSDAYIGSEIDRAQVRQFGSLMRKLAIDSNSSVVIASHPSLTGINTGTGLSGSTQWHNTVRARAYFKKPDDRSEIDDGRRELEFHKNQYGPMSKTIDLQWKAGLWLPATAKDKAADTKRIEMVFMDILRRLTTQGRKFSDKKGPTYAPAKFAEQPEAKLAKVSSKAFAEAMETLLATNIIRVVEDGRPSKRRSYLEEVPGGKRDYHPTKET